MKPPNHTFASYRMQTCGARGTDKLEFGGDAPAGNALRTLVHLRTSFGPLDHQLSRKLEFVENVCHRRAGSRPRRAGSVDMQLSVNGIGKLTAMRSALDENVTNIQRDRRGHDPALRCDKFQFTDFLTNTNLSTILYPAGGKMARLCPFLKCKLFPAVCRKYSHFVHTAKIGNWYTVKQRRGEAFEGSG